MKFTADIINNEKIRILGRHTELDGCVALDWSNSGITFRFEGTGIWLGFGEYKAPIPAYVKLIVDGDERRASVVNGSEKVMVDSLDEGEHTATLLKITE